MAFRCRGTTKQLNDSCSANNLARARPAKAVLSSGAARCVRELRPISFVSDGDDYASFALEGSRTVAALLGPVPRPDSRTTRNRFHDRPAPSPRTHARASTRCSAKMSTKADFRSIHRLL
jgi:hypothetical protein